MELKKIKESQDLISKKLDKIMMKLGDFGDIIPADNFAIKRDEDQKYKDLKKKLILANMKIMELQSKIKN